MMKSNYGSIMRKLLTVMTVIFLAVTLLGCHDPNEVNIKTEHRKLSEVAKQHLQLRHGLYTFPMTSQTETYYPAP